MRYVNASLYISQVSDEIKYIESGQDRGSIAARADNRGERANTVSVNCIKETYFHIQVAARTARHSNGSASSSACTLDIDIDIESREATRQPLDRALVRVESFPS